MKSPTTPVHLAGAKLRVSTSLKKKMSVGVAQGNEGKDRVITVCVLISKTSSNSVSDCSAHFSGLSLSMPSLQGRIFFCPRVSSPSALCNWTQQRTAELRSSSQTIASVTETRDEDANQATRTL